MCYLLYTLSMENKELRKKKNISIVPGLDSETLARAFLSTNKIHRTLSEIRVSEGHCHSSDVGSKLH